LYVLFVVATVFKTSRNRVHKSLIRGKMYYIIYYVWYKWLLIIKIYTIPQFCGIVSQLGWAERMGFARTHLRLRWVEEYWVTSESIKYMQYAITSLRINHTHTHRHYIMLFTLFCWTYGSPFLFFLFLSERLYIIVYVFHYFVGLPTCSFSENKTVHVRGHASVRRAVCPSGLFGFGGRFSAGVVVDIWRAPGRVRSRRVRAEHRHENQSVVNWQHRLRSPGKLHLSRHESRRSGVLYGRLKRTRYLLTIGLHFSRVAGRYTIFSMWRILVSCKLQLFYKINECTMCPVKNVTGRRHIMMVYLKL